MYLYLYLPICRWLSGFFCVGQTKWKYFPLYYNSNQFDWLYQWSQFWQTQLMALDFYLFFNGGQFGGVFTFTNISAALAFIWYFGPKIDKYYWIDFRNDTIAEASFPSKVCHWYIQSSSTIVIFNHRRLLSRRDWKRYAIIKLELNSSQTQLQLIDCMFECLLPRMTENEVSSGRHTQLVTWWHATLTNRSISLMARVFMFRVLSSTLSVRYAGTIQLRCFANCQCHRCSRTDDRSSVAILFSIHRISWTKVKSMNCFFTRLRFVDPFLFSHSFQSLRWFCQLPVFTVFSTPLACTHSPGLYKQITPSQHGKKWLFKKKIYGKQFNGRNQKSKVQQHTCGIPFRLHRACHFRSLEHGVFWCTNDSLGETWTQNSTNREKTKANVCHMCYPKPFQNNKNLPSWMEKKTRQLA